MLLTKSSVLVSGSGDTVLLTTSSVLVSGSGDTVLLTTSSVLVSGSGDMVLLRDEQTYSQDNFIFLTDRPTDLLTD